MKGLILAAFAVMALVVLSPSAMACNYGDGSVVGGTTFSIVQQPVLAETYTQAVVAAPVYQQAIVSPVYGQAIVGGYSQAIRVHRGLFADRVVVGRHRGLSVRIR